MNKILDILNKFKETHYKMKEISMLQKQVKKYSNKCDEIKKLYNNETNDDIKRNLLLIQFNFLECAQIKNNKVSELLDEFDIYINKNKI